MIVNFVSCHADARKKLSEAGIFITAETNDGEVAKFYADSELFAVYDAKISMLFYEPKKEDV